MKNLRLIIKTAILIIFLFSMGACVPILQNNQPEDNSSIQQFTQDIALAESSFFLQVPEPVSEDLVIELIDDVTGIELNPIRYSLQKIDDTHYGVIIPLKIGAVIKYRYYRNAGLPIYETNKNNQVIDYRAVFIDGARDFSDILTNWADRQYDYEYGRLEGQIVNSTTNAPLPNLLVIAAGVHVFTDSSGAFSIENLPPGKHNLISMSTDGEYQIFQQEAMIASGLTTPAFLKVMPSDFVNVTFLAKLPLDTFVEPLHMIGNTYQLGNVFGNVFNGESAIAARAPSLSMLPDGSYSVTLSLPVGFNLVYKYTLGNGFWNSELSQEGQFLTRSIIIPDKDTLVTDIVATFQANESSPVTFNVKVPANTPPGDMVSIQFFGYGWSSPIPIQIQENYTYSYTLYGPFNMIDEVKYRFCRNDSCAAGDDMQISTVRNPDWVIKRSSSEQKIDLQIEAWPGLPFNAQTTEIIAPEIIARSPGFVTGIQTSLQYSVFQPVYSQAGFQSIRDINANLVILPVVWTLQSVDPVILAPVIGQNPLWKDLIIMIKKAQAAGLQVVLTPKIVYSQSAIAILSKNELSEGWSVAFESEYQKLITYVTDLAQFTEARGVVFDYSFVSSASDTNNKYLSSAIKDTLVNNIDILKQKFKGEFSLSLRISDASELDPVLLDAFNVLIVDANWNLGESGVDPNMFLATFEQQLTTEVAKLHENSEKPILIRLSYPSTVGSYYGCIKDNDHCIDFDLINQQGLNLDSISGIDLAVQSQIYQTALSAINEIDWIQGVISAGYNLQLGIQDSSSSVRAKPAGDVLWYWYPRLTGILQ